MTNSISNLIQKHFPTKTVKYKKHKHRKSEWITQGIVRSIYGRDKLYCQLRKDTFGSPLYESVKNNLKISNNILNKVIRKAKFDYYKFRFDKFM